ncbi:MAG: hypothetical protein BEN18_04385 [Epulopiscium sp. Nuni2H_MBin001]|nr:MAG: hypothetical protein BEN18_04385 [Epulopiscium sp. Nuni2H_MBin001]
MYVIAIGASAGGISAINDFFDNMPIDSGAAFVLVQHLSSKHKSLMQNLLTNRTSMTVKEAEDGETIAPNTIYVMAPTKLILFKDNKLMLVNRTENESGAIDLFFKSLAPYKLDKAVGIVLSGAGSDGSEGVKSINQHGGLVIAQEQSSAQFASMPRNSINTGCVDYILHPKDMPNKIIDYIGLSPQRDYEQPQDPISKIITSLKERKGIDFADYKRSTVIRRIERRMNMLEIRTLNDYIMFIDNFPSELDTLHNEIFIGVTEFFRDDDAFFELRNNVIPQLFKNKTADIGLRIWSAGCSTGEEAYSIAILVHEYLETVNLAFNIKIFATDINDLALSKASAGIYTAEALATMSKDRLSKYFDKKGEYYQVKDIIRSMVIFAKHNIISDPPFSKLDLIVCRNLLIYLEATIQQNIFTVFGFSLNKEGYLFLGASESLGEMGKYFEQLDSRWKIFQHIRQQTASLTKPAFQLNEVVSVNFDNRLAYANVPKKWTANAEDKAIDKITQALQEEYVPKGVIVNEALELRHTFGDVNEYIKIPSNKLSLNILKMIRKDLSVAVGTALQNVFTSGKDIRYSNINTHMTLTAKLYVDEAANTRYAILLFETDAIKPAVISVQDFEFQEKAYERIADLEYELKYNKEHMQALIEELESSNEELQSANEELSSANEELQNTNEELQSVNEELYTVNSEYHKKIEELTQANDDINNLLAMTAITAIFLDKHLRIRRFTPSVKRIINLIETDIGRSIADIALKVNYEDFMDDIQSVINHLIPIETIVDNSVANKFRFTLTPYIGAEGNIKGVIINIVEL